MKKLNKILIVGLVLLAIAATSITAFAFTGSTPAEIVAGLTGNQIAYDEGSWEEFRDEMLKTKKAFLDEKVADGTLSQEEANEIYSNIEEMQENCTENGGGFGMMRNSNNGNGFGMGKGFRNGGNRGMGFGGGGGCGGSW